MTRRPGLTVKLTLLLIAVAVITVALAAAITLITMNLLNGTLQ